MSMAEYRRLYRLALDRGIKFEGRPTLDTVRARLAELDGQTSLLDVKPKAAKKKPAAKPKPAKATAKPAAKAAAKPAAAKKKPKAAKPKVTRSSSATTVRKDDGTVEVTQRGETRRTMTDAQWRAWLRRTHER